MGHTFIIAECAACHDGDYNKAVELVNLAAEIGADAVKLQYCSNPDKLAQRRRAPEYVKSYQTLQFPVEWFERLARLAEFHKLEFMCTVYLPEDIAVVAPFVSRFKVSSFEALDIEFIKAHLPYDKEIILSCGMGADDVIVEADVQYLYCVSAYPTPIEQINLSKLWADGHGGKIYDGLSDHTTHSLTGAFAVAAGAKTIEFHTRLFDTSKDNADYRVARDPVQSREYVKNIRVAETMMGSPEQGLAECEIPMMRYRVQP